MRNFGIGVLVGAFVIISFLYICNGDKGLIYSNWEQESRKEIQKAVASIFERNKLILESKTFEDAKNVFLYRTLTPNLEGGVWYEVRRAAEYELRNAAYLKMKSLASTSEQISETETIYPRLQESKQNN